MNNIRKTCQRFLVLKTSTDDCGDLGCFGDLGNLWLFMYVKAVNNCFEKYFNEKK